MNLRLLVCTGAVLAAAVVPLLAHHSIVASYDDKKTITIRGTVSKFDWANPHVYVNIDSEGKDGSLTRWEVEFNSTIIMKRAGWTKDSVKVGDTVTAVANPARDGSKEAWGKSLNVFGRVLSTTPRPPQLVKTGKPTPRYSDGHVRLGPEPGQLGYWDYPTGSSLVETSANVKMDADGTLSNISDASKVAPFLPWALGLYQYRQKSQQKDDPMASCLPPGGPRQFQAPYGIQFHEDRDRKRLFVLSGGGNRNWRLIYLDGRPLPDPDAETPTYYGFSVGKWVGDVLNIDSLGYNERFWFSNGGLPHTESLKLAEKISRPDFDTLRYEVTVTDTGAYSRPWTSSWTLRWVAGQEIPEYFCDDYNQEQLRAFEK
jgi:hypothetical protein